MRHLTWLLKRRKIGINIEIDLTWAKFIAIFYGFAARFLFGIVFVHKAKQVRWAERSSLQGLTGLAVKTLIDIEI